MPRRARIVVPGWAHHITQRGNRRQDVFHSDSQRRRYLQLLEQYASARGLVVRAYCLMTNHIHLVAVPPDADALAAVLKPVHLRYAQEYNRQMGLQGVLWQPQRGPCGRPVLLVPAGGRALLVGHPIRRAEPRSRRAGRAGSGLPVVQRRLAVRPAPRRPAAAARPAGLAAMAVEHAAAPAAGRVVAVAGRERR